MRPVTQRQIQKLRTRMKAYPERLLEITDATSEQTTIVSDKASMQNISGGHVSVYPAKLENVENLKKRNMTLSILDFERKMWTLIYDSGKIERISLRA